MFTGKREIRFVFFEDLSLKLSITTAVILQELLKWNLNLMHSNFTTGYKATSYKAGYKVRN